MGKKKGGHLVPVKKIITRGGKTFETTVLINPNKMNTVKQNSKVNVPTEDWAKIESLDDFEKYRKAIFDNKDVADKDALKNEFMAFMERSGVKWNRCNTNAGIDWMRCMMKAKKMIVNGDFIADGSGKERTASMYNPMSNDKAREEVQKLSKQFKDNNKDLLQAMRNEGIKWNESKHPGINRMRAMMELRERLVDGKHVGLIQQEVNKEYQKQMTERRKKRQEAKKKEQEDKQKQASGKQLTEEEIKEELRKYGSMKRILRFGLEHGFTIEERTKGYKLSRGDVSVTVTEKADPYVRLVSGKHTGGKGIEVNFFSQNLDRTEKRKMVKTQKEAIEFMKENFKKLGIEKNVTTKEDKKEDKKEKVPTPLKGSIQEKYHNCSKRGKILAALTGIVPEDETAEQYLEDCIKNNEFSQPHWIKDGEPKEIVEKLNKRQKDLINEPEFKAISNLEARWYEKTEPIKAREFFEQIGMVDEYNKFYTERYNFLHEFGGTYTRLSTEEMTTLADTFKASRDLKDYGLDFTYDRKCSEYIRNLKAYLLETINSNNDDLVNDAYDKLGVDNFLTAEYHSSGKSLLNFLFKGALHTEHKSSDYQEMFIKNYEASTKTKITDDDRYKTMPNGDKVFKGNGELIRDTILPKMSKKELLGLVLLTVGSAELNLLAPEKVALNAKRYAEVEKEKEAKKRKETYETTTLLSGLDKQYGQLKNIMRTVIGQTSGQYTYSVDLSKFDLDKIVELTQKAPKEKVRIFNSPTAQHLTYNMAIYNAVKHSFSLTKSQIDSIIKNLNAVPKDEFENSKKDGMLRTRALVTLYKAIKKGSKKANKEAEDIYNIASPTAIKQKGVVPHVQYVEAVKSGNYDNIEELEHHELPKEKIKTSIKTVSKEEADKVKDDLYHSNDDNTVENHKKFDLYAKNVFKITSLSYQKEADEFEKEHDHTQTLYHGTRMVATQGILGETGHWHVPKNYDDGVKSGAMIGFGVYYARHAKKSAQYFDRNGFGTGYSSIGNRGTLFVCKASLGRTHTTKKVGFEHNQPILAHSDVQTIFCPKGTKSRHNTIQNDEWATKNHLGCVPQYMVDMVIVGKGKGNLKKQ